MSIYRCDKYPVCEFSKGGSHLTSSLACSVQGCGGGVGALLGGSTSLCWFLCHISVHVLRITDAISTMHVLVITMRVVLNSAAGAVKLRERPKVPSSTGELHPVQGSPHYKGIHCRVLPPTDS